MIFVIMFGCTSLFESLEPENIEPSYEPNKPLEPRFKLVKDDDGNSLMKVVVNPPFKVVDASRIESCQSSGFFDYCETLKCDIRNPASYDSFGTINYLYVQNGKVHKKSKGYNILSNTTISETVEFPEAELKYHESAKLRCEVEFVSVDVSCEIFNQRSAAKGTKTVRVNLGVNGTKIYHDHELTLDPGESKTVVSSFSSDEVNIKGLSEDESSTYGCEIIH